MKYYLKMFSNGFTFKGNASIKEFWFAVLFDMIFSVCVQFLAIPFIFDFNVYYIVANSLVTLYSIIVFIPMLSLTVRRLHDTGHTGWMILITIIPLVGLIILIYLLCQPSIHKATLLNEDYKNNTDELYNETYASAESDIKPDECDVNKESSEKKCNEQTNQSFNNYDTNDTQFEEENSIVSEDKIIISTPKKTRVERIRECQKLLEDGKITKEDYDKIVRKILTE